MNIYRIWQDTNTGYDTYDSAVVAAKTAREAQITNIGYGWTSPENVKVEYLGKAKRGTKAGIIVASFNAG